MRWPFAILIPLLLILPGPAGADELTEQSQRAIDRAVRWILNAQNRDGSWGLDSRTPPCLTCTSLCALALMSIGVHERGGHDRDCIDAVRRALEYVMNVASKKRRAISDGQRTLIQNKLGHNVHTFFTTTFLTQAYGMRGPWVQDGQLQEMREVLSDMTTGIASTQEPDGSWHKEHFGALKATAMAWLALRSASSAGIEIKAAAVDKIVEFMKKARNPATGHFDRAFGDGRRGGGSYQSLYATSSAVRVLYGMGEGNTPEAKGGAEAFMKSVMKGGQLAAMFLTVEGEDYLSATMMTESLMHESGPLWNRWFPWIREQLVQRQANDGSWTTTACISGRTFATACAVLTLAAPYRLLPLHEH